MEMADLFRRLDADLWESIRYNPVLMLGTMGQEQLHEITEDEGFLAQMDRAAQRLEDYMQERPWYKLKTLGIVPTPYPMNEGHSVFMALERMRVLMEEHGLTFAEARQVSQASQMFTTHTPVPAGIDLFPPDKVPHYLGHYRQRFGLGEDSEDSEDSDYQDDVEANALY
jgi:glucan phosphorylase